LFEHNAAKREDEAGLLGEGNELVRGEQAALPDLYGTVLSGSPGAGYKPPGVMPSSLPRTYLVAGTKEPFSSTTPPGGRSRCALQVRTS